MLRSPARKSIKVLTADAVKLVGGILHISGEPPLAATNVKNCNLACAGTGTARVVTICASIPETCECPFVWSVVVKHHPDLTQYDTDDVVQNWNDKIYEFAKPDGSAPTALEVAAGIVAQINADPSSPVTAAAVECVEGEGNTGIQLTGKTNGLTFDAYTVYGTVTVTTAGSPDVLTEKYMQKLFPITHGKFGEIPPSTFCGNYCLLSATIVNCCGDTQPSDAYDISMDRSRSGYDFDILWAIPKSMLTPTTEEEVELLANLQAVFPCLETQADGSQGPEEQFVLSAVAVTPGEATDAYLFTFVDVPTNLQGDAFTWQYFNTSTNAWVTGNGGGTLPSASTGTANIAASSTQLAAGTYFIRVHATTDTEYSTIVETTVS